MAGKHVHRNQTDLNSIDKYASMVALGRGRVSTDAVDALMALAIDGSRIVPEVVARLRSDVQEDEILASRLHSILRGRATRSQRRIDQAFESFTGVKPDTYKDTDKKLLRTTDRTIRVPETLRAYHGNSYDWEGEFDLALKMERARSLKPKN